MPIVVGGGSQSPASQTLSTLQTIVARYVGAPDHAEVLAMAKDEINMGVRELNTRAWYWALTYTDLTLVADQQEYTLPSNFKSARSCSRLNTDNEIDGALGYHDPKTFDHYYPTQTASGTPCAYAVYSFLDTAKLTLDVPPASTFVASYPKIRVRYFARVPVLANASDTLPVPSEAELFVIWYARHAVCLQWDPDGRRCATAERERYTIWKRLVSDDNETHFRDWSD